LLSLSLYLSRSSQSKSIARKHNQMQFAL
jgi:hypothetical protein